MPGSQTTPGQPGARNSAPVRVAFRQHNGVGPQNHKSFAAQWLGQGSRATVAPMIAGTTIVAIAA